MDLPWRTELDVNWRWIDKVINDNNGVAGTVPSYAEMDVRLGWHATKNLEISVVGQNLLHRQHAEAGFPGTGAGTDRAQHFRKNRMELLIPQNRNSSRANRFAHSRNFGNADALVFSFLVCGCCCFASD